MEADNSEFPVVPENRRDHKTGATEPQGHITRQWEKCTASQKEPEFRPGNLLKYGPASLKTTSDQQSEARYRRSTKSKPATGLVRAFYPDAGVQN